MIFNVPFIAVAALILIGLYAVIFKRNLIKMVIGITLIESGVYWSCCPCSDAFFGNLYI